MSLLSLLLPGGMALLASLAFSGVASLSGPRDAPHSRASHSRATATAGGLGVVAALGAACLLPGAPPAPRETAMLLAVLLGAGVLGLCDDLAPLRARSKFGALLVLCGAATWTLGPVRELPLSPAVWGVEALVLPLWLGAAGTVLWLFVVVNAVNFMDGVNGMLAGVGTALMIVFAGLASALGANGAVLLAVATAGALLGLMPYNFRTRARLFAGDTGALVVGLLLGLVPLMIARTAPDALYVGPLLLLPFLADVFATLVRRARARANLLSPHREHLYQFAARRIGHIPTVSLYMAALAPLTLWVLVALHGGWADSLLALLGLAAATGAASARLSRHLDLQERRSTT